MDTGETVGSRAKTVRLEAHKTQKQMAEFLQIATATWQKIERDEGLPNGETLMQFTLLGVNPGWLLTGLGPKSLDVKGAAVPRRDEEHHADDLTITVNGVTTHVQVKTAPQKINPAFFSQLKLRLKAAYQRCGLHFSEEKYMIEVVDHYYRVVDEKADLADAEEVELRLRLAEKAVEKEAKEAKEHPGTGKRSAF